MISHLFFDFAAEVGLTKHIGGVEATEDLASFCHISEGITVLDVGCGVGVTTCFLASKYGCRVVRVDVSQGMFEKSRKRERKEKVLDKVDFRVADAQSLEVNAVTGVKTKSANNGGFFCAPMEIRTPVSALKGPRPGPLDDGG